MIVHIVANIIVLAINVTAIFMLMPVLSKFKKCNSMK